MRSLVLAGVVSLGIGCGGSSKPSAPPYVPGPTCKATAGHMVDLMVAQKDPRPADQVVNAMIELIRNRCDLDHWSPEALKCLGTMKSPDEADMCGTLLTDEQQAALVKDQTATLGAKGAAPGGGAPPSPSDPDDGHE